MEVANGVPSAARDRDVVNWSTETCENKINRNRQENEGELVSPPGRLGEGSWILRQRRAVRKLNHCLLCECNSYFRLLTFHSKRG